MPYITSKEKIDCPFMDKRVKLLPCQKEMVLHWREQGLSQRRLAKMFKVSRRLITFVLDEQKHIANLKAREERGGSKQYYDREKHNEYMRTHRRSKHERLKDVPKKN